MFLFFRIKFTYLQNLNLVGNMPKKEFLRNKKLRTTKTDKSKLDGSLSDGHATIIALGSSLFLQASQFNNLSEKCPVHNISIKVYSTCLLVQESFYES